MQRHSRAGGNAAQQVPDEIAATNSSSPLGCAVDPSDPCADGVLDRTWDLCNVVDLHLVTDRISSTTTTGGSLNATLYGKDRVTLKRAQLSDFILQHKVSKVTLALDNDTAVESVKIEATASMSLRIYEVQTTVNNLPTTIFSPPSPGPISFVSSEETSSTGVVSLLFVPVTEYFNSDVLSQCYFDLVGRCGYHADLQNSFDLFFLAEDNNEPIVAAKSSASPSFRRLSEQEKPRAPTPRPLSFLPKSERLLVDSSEEERRLNTDDTTSQNAVILEMLALIIDLEEDAPLRLVMSELLVIDTTTIAATCHTTFMVFHVENVIRSAKAPSLGVQNVSDIHDPTVAHSCTEKFFKANLPK
ncbi:hypothetical protein PF011_g1178 [Phytophthora fragariae]|uniref:Uncharacterized protein n=1 Tax=Phytophthora fragariae TaxID=53985 RepID=A0A6A3MCG2_9STRA|nr:hypothetical protein PF011_g1178 [Phytophthora fragariae]